MESPSFSKRAWMNRSISLCSVTPEVRASGTAGRTGVRNDQCARGSTSGQTAPSEIQRRKLRTSAAVNRGSLGGITSSGSSVVTRFRSSLSSGLPGTSASFPDLAGFNASARVSNRRSPFCLSGP